MPNIHSMILCDFLQVLKSGQVAILKKKYSAATKSEHDPKQQYNRLRTKVRHSIGAFETKPHLETADPNVSGIKSNCNRVEASSKRGEPQHDLLDVDRRKSFSDAVPPGAANVKPSSLLQRRFSAKLLPIRTESSLESPERSAARESPVDRALEAVAGTHNNVARRCSSLSSMVRRSDDVPKATVDTDEDLTIEGAVKVDFESMSPMSPDQSASVTDPFQPVRESGDGDDESRGSNFELEGCSSTDDNADPYTPRDEPSTPVEPPDSDQTEATGGTTNKKGMKASNVSLALNFTLLSRPHTIRRNRCCVIIWSVNHKFSSRSPCFLLFLIIPH